MVDHELEDVREVRFVRLVAFAHQAAVFKECDRSFYRQGVVKVQFQKLVFFCVVSVQRSTIDKQKVVAVVSEKLNNHPRVKERQGLD